MSSRMAAAAASATTAGPPVVQGSETSRPPLPSSSGGGLTAWPSLSPSPSAARQRRLRWNSSPRGTRRRSAVGAPRSLQRDSAFREIDAQELEAEVPRLVDHCSDLDWQKLAADLREEALHGLRLRPGLAPPSLGALEQLMGSWIHERVAAGLERPVADGEDATVAVDPEWSADAAAQDLRMAANMQAAQELAKSVDSTFDWEIEAGELHRRILQQGAAEQPKERTLWRAWSRARGQVHDTSDQLLEESLASTPLNWDAESLSSESRLTEARSKTGSDLNGQPRGKSFLVALGATMASGVAWEGSLMGPSVARADDLSTEAIQAVSSAPSWLVPAVLVFPPLSYFLFNVYRDKVNPQARLSDWMFGMVAVVIVSNLVTRAVWGVRLY